MTKATMQRATQADSKARLAEWLKRLDALAAEITQWSRAQRWDVDRHETQITETPFGCYAVPALSIRLKSGKLMLNPVGLRVPGGKGRVDLEAIPTLSRVRLLPVKDGWEIWTDSNIPLRVPWNRRSFVQIAEDLVK